MATPIIQSVGTTSGAGTPGEGRNDLVISETVNLSDTEPLNVGASYSWTFEDKPIGSASTLVDAATATPSFVPDVTGSYRINCLVNSIDSSIEVLAVPLPNTASRIPSFAEETEYDASGNTKGWHEAQTVFMREVDSQLGATAADALSTTGADVDVSAAAPPTTDQVLKATGATTATWQDESGAIGPVFVLRPGGTAGGNVFTDFDLLNTAIADSNFVPTRVLFDDSLGTITVPAAAGYEMYNVEWVGTKPFGETIVYIGEGAYVDGLQNLRNITVINQSTTSIPCYLDAGWIVSLHEGTQVLSEFGAEALFESPFEDEATFELFDSWLGGNGEAVLEITANAYPTVKLKGTSGLGEDAISGGASAELYLYLFGSGADWYTDQSTNFSGSIYVESDQKQSLTILPPYGAGPSTTPLLVEMGGGQFLRYDATAGQISQTLPLVVEYRSTSGKEIRVKEYSGVNGVLLSPESGDTINGGASYLVPAGMSATFVSDGISDWSLTATTASGDTDEKVGVTSNDTTPDYLLNKLAEGAAISITETGDGGDEDATIAVSDLTDSEVAAANVDGVAGTASMRTLGTGAQTACAGNDSRLSDARTPTSHASSHLNAGGDTLASDVIKTTTGPTDMVVGAVADGQYLKRSGSTVVGDTPAGGTTAEALATTGADVDVSAAAPPTTGQVLKATAATTATWQDESGGSSQVLAAAGGDYIQAKLSADQGSVTAADTTIEFDTAVTSRGDLAVDSAGKFSTLKAGRTYYLFADLYMNTTAVTRLPFNWYDRTNTADIGNTGVAVSGEYSASTALYTKTAAAIVTPTEDIEVEVRTSAATVGGATCTIKGTAGWANHTSTAIIMEIGAVQANVIGGLEYLDTIEVGSAVSSVAFGASGDGIHQRALDGDVDQQYVLVHYLTASGAMTVSLQPNGIVTNQESQRVTFESSFTTFSTLAIAQLSDSNDFVFGETTFDARRSVGGVAKNRMYFTNVVFNNGTASFGRHFCGTWAETATNITSLEIAASTGTISAGSSFVLYRRTSNNLRADNASTYERNVEATVAQGTNSEVEYTTGHATYQGSAVGLSVSLNDTVTAGTVTVNLKVGGVTKLTATLNTTDTYFARAIESVGVHTMAPGDEIEVGIATSGLTTTGGGTPGITVNATLVNSALVQSPTQIGYAELSLSASQTTNIAVDNHVEFDQIASRGDLFSLATGAGQADGLLTVQPGTYEVEFHTRIQGNGNDAVTFTLRDHSDDSTVASDSGRSLVNRTATLDNSSAWSDHEVCKAICTFASEITLKLDITDIAGTLVQVSASAAWIIIKELR